ncbi:GlxA family transcriptional regulator [Jannaschia sp. M317]|uniref:GlxA family transcriptional regulator n=1 Tax=Jannaschia sp. M317 TaxID=2867011 RepID=UPI0021A5C60C|nr:GlxA family transcriptional regulator [Jannaschia sp. M317]UWQ16392.1 GlxA family transcriptional regulator [Jannaschia sp. M317]
MVAYPGAHNLDVVGPLEILATTAHFAADNIRPYDIAIVAEKAGPIEASSGLTITAALSFEDVLGGVGEIDTLMIAGGHGSSSAMKDRVLVEFLRAAAPRTRRIASICTGALVLAEAGLLDGRRASTHWFWCPKMETDYPAVEVDRDAIFVRDGNVWTSAGVTSGMDLALALVEDDLGHEAALQVARFSVMYMMRPGGQSQFSAHLVAQRAEDPAINATLEFILGNPGHPLTVTGLAAQVGLSERTFARRFKDETGMTPAAYVETARIQAARVALETTSRGVELIAMETGFQNGERMRRAFQRQLGVSASEYRDRFRGSHEAQP